MIAGLTRYVTKAHLARAVLEATAGRPVCIADAMTKDSGVELTALKVDGGMTSNNLLMQTLADFVDAPVVRPMVAETTCLGAAYAAGLAVGFWNSTDDLRANWRRAAEWTPRMDAETRDREEPWLKAVKKRTMGWLEGGDKPRDLVLVRGIEPSMRWRSFCNELLGFAHELGVELVVVLGALLGDTPHTRPVPISGTTSDADLARRMDLEETKYEGPTGIVGILQEACAHAGVPAVSLWAAVPHYVSQPPNPKATLALLNRLEDLIGVRVPLGELAEDARAWQVGVDQLAAEDTEVAEYVQSLEEARDTAELPEASGEAIAREFERYLRRRDGAGPGGPGPGSPGGHATADGGDGPSGAPFLRDNPSGRTRPPKPPKAGGDDEESSEDSRATEPAEGRFPVGSAPRSSAGCVIAPRPAGRRPRGRPRPGRRGPCRRSPAGVRPSGRPP
ncbi:Glycerol kinase [Streptomyces tendae]